MSKSTLRKRKYRAANQVLDTLVNDTFKNTDVFQEDCEQTTTDTLDSDTGVCTFSNISLPVHHERKETTDFELQFTDNTATDDNDGNVDDNSANDNNFDVFDSFNIDSESDSSGSDNDDRSGFGTDRAKDLHTELLLFFILFRISHNAMKYLLDLLNRFNLEVPKSIYLLKSKISATNFTVNKFANGSFVYFSILDNLKYLVENNLMDNLNTNDLKVSINIDGMPLYRSSHVSVWPILLKVHGVFRPLIIGIYVGLHKPPLEDYLQHLIDELNILKTTGMHINGYNFKFTKVLFVCDAPARAHLMCIKGHNAKLGCQYCRQQGYCEDHHTVFCDKKSESRTNDSYIKNEENNQLCISPLSNVFSINFYSSFVPDYQHCVCLGVTRKLFHLYFDNNKRVKQTAIVQMSTEISQLAKYTPHEFQRRPRRIDKELAHFKATEFRLFLLYLGPFLFKKYLPTPLYHHFLLLHFAIYVLSSNSLSKSLFSQADGCLQLFVSQVSQLFGKFNMTYNMHILLHLPEFVKQHGTLNEFSTFEFENLLSRLKLHIRKTRFIESHVFNQAAVLRSYKFCNPVNDLHFFLNTYKFLYM